MENLQICYENSRTKIKVGLTPERKFVQEKKEDNLDSIFVVSSRDCIEPKQRVPIEVFIVVFVKIDFEKIEEIELNQTQSNIKRGISKICKHLKENDKVSLIVIGNEKVEILKKSHVIESSSPLSIKGTKKLLEDLYVNHIESIIKNNNTKRNYEEIFEDGIDLVYKLAKENTIDLKNLKESTTKKNYELDYTYLGNKLKRIFVFSNHSMFPDHFNTQKIKKDEKKKITEQEESKLQSLQYWKTKVFNFFDHFGVSISVIGFGSNFSHQFFYQISRNSGGNFYFAKDPVEIPKKVSKEIHAITDELIARNGIIELNCQNGLYIKSTNCFYKVQETNDTEKEIQEISKKSKKLGNQKKSILLGKSAINQSSIQEKSGGMIKFYVNDITKDNFRKILFSIIVKVKDKKKTEFIDFTFRFIPVDAKPYIYQQIKGKLRLYTSIAASDFRKVTPNEFIETSKIIHQLSQDMHSEMMNFLESEIQHISSTNITKKRKKGFAGLGSVFSKKKKGNSISKGKGVNDCLECIKSVTKQLTKWLGKDSSKHIEKITRILFSIKETILRIKNHISNQKEEEENEIILEELKIAQHIIFWFSKILEDDNDFGYVSGKDSDFGAWEDHINESTEESEESDTANNEDEEEGELLDIDLDDDDGDEDGFTSNEEDLDDEEGDEFEFDDEEDEFTDIKEYQGRKDEAIVVDIVKLIEEQQEKIKNIAEALNISTGIAGALLKYFKWNSEKLYQEFFDNKEKLCKKANIVISKDPFFTMNMLGKKNGTCPVCYMDYKGTDFFGLGCKHFFCKSCWQEYFSVQIADGPGCLMTKCPYLGCTMIVNEELVKSLVDKDNWELYNRYLVRSFVDDNPKIKWCPAPDCGKAVYCPDSAQDNVICSCGQKFCFKCQLEAHEPCNCQSLAKWRLKEKDESETANWLVVNTKLCPHCNKPIEKNGGCNHMTCPQCKHEFCWVCMDPWSEHGTKTGGFYKCNKYNEDELKKKLDTGKIDEARAELEKYMHYFKRYANHLNSQKFELELKKKSEKKMQKLQVLHKYSSWSDVEYITAGIQQLIECRRTLKYTYIHAYFINSGREKNLFEFLQEDLERETERLSGLLEKEVEKFDRDSIIASTKSAKTRLKNLLEGSKTGLIIK